MLNDVKISLTINVEGSTRHCVGKIKIPYKITKQDMTTVKLPKEIGNKIVKRGTIEDNNYEYVPAKVHINMYRSAYEYMTSKETPEGYFKKDWARLSLEQKLNWHIAKIAKRYNSKEYSYNILDD